MEEKNKKPFFVGHKTACSTTVLDQVNCTRLGKVYNDLTSALGYQRSSGLISLYMKGSSFLKCA